MREISGKIRQARAIVGRAASCVPGQGLRQGSAIPERLKPSRAEPRPPPPRRAYFGELWNDLHQALPCLHEQLIDFVRFDLSHSGGITSARSIAAVADAYAIRTAWHGPGDISPILRGFVAAFKKQVYTSP